MEKDSAFAWAELRIMNHDITKLIDQTYRRYRGKVISTTISRLLSIRVSK